jgi:hypothetical protein
VTEPLGARRQLDLDLGTVAHSIVALRGLSHETAKGGGEERNQLNLLLQTVAQVSTIALRHLPERAPQHVDIDAVSLANRPDADAFPPDDVLRD